MKECSTLLTVMNILMQGLVDMDRYRVDFNNENIDYSNFEAMVTLAQKGFDIVCDAKLVVVMMMSVVEIEVHGVFKVKVGIMIVQSVMTSLDSSLNYNAIRTQFDRRYDVVNGVLKQFVRVEQ
ncbi:hypothetical protein PPACK8108_LOCUS6713 [Phakopsora pachyrhizi]|uniref:Uncharacterized protein n=1 Tax=Phakopsora pachyrhizi TaxID=170000 RepID=A0AAV0AU83_PHAPC|nr:hypothetical protein PPACK8108_LOCUS6713 [Phakopsora pachyrhizi]